MRLHFHRSSYKSGCRTGCFNIPYTGILKEPVKYSEIEHMLEQVKHEMNIRRMTLLNHIRAHSREKNAKITRINKARKVVVG